MVDSISKTPVDRDQASSVVTAHFGPGVALVELDECDEGWFNAVYRLGLGDGSTCVLKVAPPPDLRVMRYEHDLLATEVDALRLVRDRTDVPAPAVLAHDDSCRLLPSPYFVMERCPGVLLSEVRNGSDTADAARIDGQLAGLLASMNSIEGPAFGRPDRTAPRDPSWSRAFGRLVADLLADAADADVELPVRAEEITGIVARCAGALDVVTTPRFVHWDLWDTNVFVDPGTWAVVGVIDFERVLWGDPLMEAQFVGRRADDALTGAYGEPLFASPGAVERRRLYDLYLYLVMTIECAYRNYPTDDIEQLGRTCLATTLDEIRGT